jgi:hypothetical protein
LHSPGRAGVSAAAYWNRTLFRPAKLSRPPAHRIAFLGISAVIRPNIQGKKMTSNSIHFDELSKYSSWPKRLLSLEDFPIKYKTKKEVLREFDSDKWGELVTKLQCFSGDSIAQVEQFLTPENTILPIFRNGTFLLAPSLDITKYHLDLYEEFIAPFAENASALVELGAGYGSKIFGLSDRTSLSHLPLTACEYTENGQKAITMISRSINKKINVGFCDFSDLAIDAEIIPKNAIIFTSYAAHYIPNISEKFVELIASLEPKIVINFEPLYEIFSSDSIFEMMCRRYMDLNDYTKNLLSIINKANDSGAIEIILKKKNVLSSNPFLPISVLAWRPI